MCDFVNKKNKIIIINNPVPAARTAQSPSEISTERDLCSQ